MGEGWDVEKGGELVLLPFLQEPVTLVPHFDRSVMLLSDRILHRSLPPSKSGSTCSRWLLTLWFEGKHVDQLCGSMWPPLLQRLVAPLLYAKDYLEALEQSFPCGEIRQALLEAQLKEIRAIECDEELLDIVHQLRDSATAAGESPGLKSRRISY